MTSENELFNAFVIVLLAAAGAGGLAVVCVTFSKIFDVSNDEPGPDEPLNGDARANQYAHQHPEIRSKGALLPPPIPFYDDLCKLNRWAGQIDPKNEYLKSQLKEVMRELPPLQVQQVQRKAAARRKNNDDRKGV